jgi:hypothetical protein
VESEKLKKISSEKSLLWIHGGHPFLPTSSDLHDKNQQLLKLSEALCPRKRASNSNQGLLLHFLLLVFFMGQFRCILKIQLTGLTTLLEKCRNVEHPSCQCCCSI